MQTLNSNINQVDKEIESLYKKFINDNSFPCIGAKASHSKNQAFYMVAGNMGCPSHDKEILEFIYQFTDEFRKSGGGFFSAAVIFNSPLEITESIFETLIWQRLQAISDLDANLHPYDYRVSPDISSSEFSFSLKEEAFFIVGMHPGSSRPARRFQYPTLIFNPHIQFENLKKTAKYKNMQRVIRKKDIALSGSINPMLNDHGTSSEILQYSGKNYITSQQCPFHSSHGKK